MRVALVNGGTFPYRTGALGTWCHRLVRGLSEYQYQLVTLVDTATERLYRPLSGAPNLTPVLLDGAPVGPTRGREALQHRRLATHAAVLLCRGMLDDSEHSAAMFRSALRRMVATGADGTHPLHGVPLGAVLLDAWKAGGLQLPRASVASAQDAAYLLELAVRPLAARLDPVDLYHTVNSGLSTMVGLAAKWRDGTPYVLTEHNLYLHDPFLDRAGAHQPVRAVLLRFLRALTRLAYREAAAVAPPSERMRRWALHHGAARELITVIPPGVDPHAHPPLRDEPAEPVTAWVGPDDERDLILAAFEGIREAVPGARLIVIGTAPAGGWPAGVSFTGPVAGRRPLYAMAQLVAISGNDPGMPYPLIEAMMCGRPAVCTESGGLAATVGMGATVVAGGDPAALATACVSLLRDARLRREVSNSARQRSRTLFSLNAMLDSYRGVYAQALRSGADRSESLAVLA